MKTTLWLLAFLLLAVWVEAGNSTLTYTTQQSTKIQSTVIPVYNRKHCKQFGKPDNCTTADLTAAGCVPVVIKTVTYDSCTIFTQDAAGEQKYLQERMNQQLVDDFNATQSVGSDDFCTAYANSSTTAQQNSNTAIGLPATHSGPCKP